MKRKVIIITVLIFIIIILGGFAITKIAAGAKVKSNIELGNKYLDERKYNEAIIAFKKAIEIEPKNIKARIGLAKVYTLQGKLNDAEKVLRECIDIKENNPESYMELAKLYMSEKRLGDALKILNEGYRITKDAGINSMIKDIKAKIRVENISTTSIKGRPYSLPDKVTVLVDGVKFEVSVSWATTVVDTNQVGMNTFNGKIEYADIPIQLSLKIIGIASIDDISSKVKQGEKYELQSKLTAKMTDGTTTDYSVSWKPNTVDTSKVGSYDFEGTVDGYDKKVKLTLKVESSKIARSGKQVVTINSVTEDNKIVIGDYLKAVGRAPSDAIIYEAGTTSQDLKILDLSRNVSIELLQFGPAQAGMKIVTLEQFKQYINSKNRRSFNFTITIENGVVTKIMENYCP